MIEVDYRHFGILKAKQIFFGDYLPSCEGYDYIHCKNYFTDLPYREPFSRIECSSSIFDLTQDSDKLMGRMSRTRRNDIRRALKKDYRIKHHRATTDMIKLFKGLYREFAAVKGAQPLRWQSINSLIPHITIFTGEYNDINYQMNLLVHDGQTVRGHYMYRNLHHPNYQYCNLLNSLLTWESMLHFQRLGYHIFDFGGYRLDPKDPQYNNAQYKRTFGGEIVPTYWYQAKISPLARMLDSGRTILRRLRGSPE